MSPTKKGIQKEIPRYARLMIVAASSLTFSEDKESVNKPSMTPIPEGEGVKFASIFAIPYPAMTVPGDVGTRNEKKVSASMLIISKRLDKLSNIGSHSDWMFVFKIDIPLQISFANP